MFVVFQMPFDSLLDRRVFRHSILLVPPYIDFLHNIRLLEDFHDMEVSSARSAFAHFE